MVVQTEIVCGITPRSEGQVIYAEASSFNLTATNGVGNLCFFFINRDSHRTKTSYD
jgi:hypothetical protein